MLRRIPNARQRHAGVLWESCRGDTAELQSGVRVTGEITQAVVTPVNHDLAAAAVAGYRRAIIENFVCRGGNKEIALRSNRFSFQCAQFVDVLPGKLVALAGMVILLWAELPLQQIVRPHCRIEQRRLQLDRKSTRLNSSHVEISYA